MKRLALLLMLLVQAAGIATAADLVPLTITGADGTAHVFQVEIAERPDDRARGLMFRDSLAADRGMLFIFPRPERIAMWMRNTRIPLDMLFIGDDGKVAQIHERAVPHSEDIISSRIRVRYVLELPGGTADQLGLAVGAVITTEALR